MSFRTLSVAVSTVASLYGLGCASAEPEVSAGTSLSECDNESVEETIAIDEESPLGFSGADLMAGRLESTGSLSWRTVDPTVAVVMNLDPVATSYRLRVEAIGNSAKFIHGENRSCFDRVQVPVSWVLSTDDGQLNESGEGTLVASTLDRVELAIGMEASAIEGSLDISAATGMSEPQLRLSVTWSGNGRMGLVALTAKATDGGRLSQRTLAEFAN